MSDKCDGGRAFPGPSFTRNGMPNGHDMGMSLRDWFAGQALAGMMADSEVNCSAEPAARYCYEIADAMLKARGGE